MTEISELTSEIFKNGEPYRVWGYTRPKPMNPEAYVVYGDDIVYVLHREDGPALISDERKEMTFIWHGQEMSFDKWCHKTKIPPSEKMCLQLRYAGYENIND